MSFSSFSFFIFFPIVFIVYWLLLNRLPKLQNIFLLIASYVFYGSWNWRFLFLLFGISLVSYLLGMLITDAKTKGRKRLWLVSGIFANVLVLAYFKYFNFFTESFVDLFSLLGFVLNVSTLKIILPLGLSFYIFLALSYLIEIYRGRLESNNNIIDVFLSLSFFPIILAGPIQRPISLLPQIKKTRIFNYDLACEGIKQIVWGLFMKVVIADSFGPYVDDIFKNTSSYSGSTLLLGGIFYSIQIYTDFAGYSEIAIGVSKLLGFELMRNFAFPYFAKDITEFWRRWHMSLTSWFRDYIFLPIAYFISRKIPAERICKIKTDLFIYIVGIFITWFLTGLWHGGNYTFIVWGLIHGSLLIIYHMLKKSRKKLLLKWKIRNNGLIIIGIERIITLFLIIIAWIIFRSDSLIQAAFYLKCMFSSSFLTIPQVPIPLKFIVPAIFLFIIEWYQKDKKYSMDFTHIKVAYRWIIYEALILYIVLFAGGQQQFIYFNF